MGIMIIPNSQGCCENKSSVNVSSIYHHVHLSFIPMLFEWPLWVRCQPSVRITATNKMDLATALIIFRDQLPLKRSRQMDGELENKKLP